MMLNIRVRFQIVKNTIPTFSKILGVESSSSCKKGKSNLIILLRNLFDKLLSWVKKLSSLWHNNSSRLPIVSYARTEAL